MRAYLFLTNLAGFPATTESAGTSLVTTLQAPTIAPAPIVMPGMIKALAPMKARAPMVIFAVCNESAGESN